VKDLRSYIRYPAWVAGDLVSTPLWFFLFAPGVVIFSPTGEGSSAQTTSFLYLGFLFVVLFSTILWGIGQSVRNEQMAGTLEQFLLAPANRMTLIIGRWARVFLTDGIIMGYTTLLISMVQGLPIVLLDPPLFLFSLMLFELGVIGLGLLFAGLTMRIKSYNTISNLVFFGYIILTGALFPIAIVPLPFRYVSMMIPFTYFIDLMRHAAIDTATILPETLEVATAMLLAVVMVLVGSFSFKRIERQARVLGSVAAS